MDKKILLIEDLYEEGFTSGTKARQDVRKIIDGDISTAISRRNQRSEIMHIVFSDYMPVFRRFMPGLKL